RSPESRRPAGSAEALLGRDARASPCPTGTEVAADGRGMMAGAMSAEVPLDEDEFHRWRGEADRALSGARAQGDLGLHNWACFGAEQAAQLALKGLLHG